MFEDAARDLPNRDDLNADHGRRIFGVAEPKARSEDEAGGRLNMEQNPGHFCLFGTHFLLQHIAERNIQGVGFVGHLARYTGPVYLGDAMKNPKRFKIPLRWGRTEHFETARANTMALPCEGIPLPIMGVVRIGTSGNKPKCRIEGNFFNWKQVVVGSKLELFPVGAHVLIEQNIEDITTFVIPFKDGVIHALSWVDFHEWRSLGRLAHVFTLCREERSSIPVDRYPVGPGTPTCPSCLRVKSAWFLYSVEPYSHPRAIEKLEGKIRERVRKHENYPTAYDHLLRDVFSDDPDLPPAPLPKPAPKPIIVLPGASRQREKRQESAKKGKSYAEERAELLRKVRGR